MSAVLAAAPTASPADCGRCIPVVGRPGDVLFYVPPVPLYLVNGDRMAACEAAVKLYKPEHTFPCNYDQIDADDTATRPKTGPLCVLFLPMSADVYTPCVVKRFLQQYAEFADYAEYDDYPAYYSARMRAAFARLGTRVPRHPLTVERFVQEIRNTARPVSEHLAAWQNTDWLAAGRVGRVIHYNIFSSTSGVFPGTHTPPHPWSKRNPKYNTYAVIDWESVPADHIIHM